MNFESREWDSVRVKYTGNPMSSALQFISKIYLPCIFAVLFTGLLAGIIWASPGYTSVLAAPQADPMLSIPKGIPANPNSIVDIPVQFTANNNKISSLVFSLNYDEYWLNFDPNVPLSITMNLPAGFSGGCTPDTGDQDGEIDCFIMDPLPPLDPLPDDVIVTVKLRTLNPPSPTEAVAGFSQNSPPPSFGNDQGQSVPGVIENGSVQIGQVAPSPFIFLPLVMKSPSIIPTPTPTSTLPPGPTPTPTNTPTPPHCNDIIINGGFEQNLAWEIPATEYTASYSNAQAHSGNWSMRTGIINQADNRYSYSSARQMVYIPSNTYNATLRVHLYPITTEGGLALQRMPWLSQLLGLYKLPQPPTPGEPFGEAVLANDVQYVLVLDAYNNVLQHLLWDLSGAERWIEKDYNITGYAGQTIKIQVGTYNDGWYGVSAMYIDDVSLEVCR